MEPTRNRWRPWHNPAPLLGAIPIRILRPRLPASWKPCLSRAMFRMILRSTRIRNIHSLVDSARTWKPKPPKMPGRGCYHSFMSTSVKNIFSRMRKIHPALSLLIIALLAYGILIPWLGFYWDDMPMSWIRYELGPAAMTRYFSTNRPVWGLLYQLTTRLLPQVPVFWQIFALVWRWLGAVAVWAIVGALWKDKPR